MRLRENRHKKQNKTSTKEANFETVVIVALLIFYLIGIVIGFQAGKGQGEMKVQKQAIEKGYGLMKNEKFKWKRNKNEM